MTDVLLKRIAARYPLTPIEAGELATLKASGMRFTVEAYRAEELGQVSVMRAKGFFGLMRMDTLIVNPTALDLPLYSYDRIFAMGNDTLITELYDTTLTPFEGSTAEAVKAAFADVEERDPGVHWYDHIKLPCSISKKGKCKVVTARLDALTVQHFDAYLREGAPTVSDTAAKRAKTAVYVEGLLEKGGPSTDAFKKALGAEKTAVLFRTLLFGTAE